MATATAIIQRHHCCGQLDWARAAARDEDEDDDDAPRVGAMECLDDGTWMYGGMQLVRDAK